MKKFKNYIFVENILIDKNSIDTIYYGKTEKAIAECSDEKAIFIWLKSEREVILSKTDFKEFVSFFINFDNIKDSEFVFDDEKL